MHRREEAGPSVRPSVPSLEQMNFLSFDAALISGGGGGGGPTGPKMKLRVSDFSERASGCVESSIERNPTSGSRDCRHRTCLQDD